MTFVQRWRRVILTTLVAALILTRLYNQPDRSAKALVGFSLAFAALIGLSYWRARRQQKVDEIFKSSGVGSGPTAASTPNSSRDKSRITHG